MEFPEPLAVWDCNDAASVIWNAYMECCAWAQGRIADTEETHRIDFHLTDVPFAVVYRYRRLPNGLLAMDWDCEDPPQVAQEEPVVVLLSELPPAWLLHA